MCCVVEGTLFYFEGEASVSEILGFRGSAACKPDVLPTLLKITEDGNFLWNSFHGNSIL